MLETPVEGYLLKNLKRNENNNETLNNTNNNKNNDKNNDDNNNNNNIPENTGSSSDNNISLIRQLFNVCIVEGIKLYLILFVMYLIIIIIRITIYRTQTPMRNPTWSLTAAIPIVTMSLFFFIPIFIPILLILSESITTADLLSTSEIVLNTNNKSDNKNNLNKKRRHSYSVASVISDSTNNSRSNNKNNISTTKKDYDDLTNENNDFIPPDDGINIIKSSIHFYCKLSTNKYLHCLYYNFNNLIYF